MFNRRHGILFALLAVALLGSASSVWTSAAQRGRSVDQTRTAGRPTILFADVNGGPTQGGPNDAGVPISIFGHGFGPAKGASKITIGGVEVARYLVWGTRNANNPTLDMIVVQPGRKVRGGDIVVTVNGARSNVVRFTPHAGSLYFIAPSGKDSNECSERAPCATVQHVATNVMRAGDTALLRGGSYNESEIWIRADQGHSGTPRARKVVKAYPNESVVFTNPARPWILNADYITVSGIEFANGKALGNGSNDVGQQGNWIINNVFRGAIDYEATGASGNDHVLAGNRCEVTGSTQGTQGHCYYISFGNNVQLRYNVGRGAPGYGIHVFDQRRKPNDFRRVISNILIEGNELTGSTNRAGLIVTMGDEDAIGNVIDGVTIRGNTFAGNDQLGAVVGGNVRNVTVTGNRFVQNGNAGLYVGGDAITNDVRVVDNTFEQSANDVCKIDCTWYPVAHVIVKPQARGVTLLGNRYAPGKPITVGVIDPEAR